MVCSTLLELYLNKAKHCEDKMVNGIYFLIYFRSSIYFLVTTTFICIFAGRSRAGKQGSCSAAKRRGEFLELSLTEPRALMSSAEKT